MTLHFARSTANRPFANPTKSVAQLQEKATLSKRRSHQRLRPLFTLFIIKPIRGTTSICPLVLESRSYTTNRVKLPRGCAQHGTVRRARKINPLNNANLKDVIPYQLNSISFCLPYLPYSQLIVIRIHI